MNTFVHVSFLFHGVPKMRDLEPVMGFVSDDWIRYSATNWLLWTNRPTGAVLSAILPYIDQVDNVLVAPIDVNNCMGRMPPWVWTWMNGRGAGISVGPVVSSALSNFPSLPKPRSY